jgi:hypothetical protein
MGLTPAQFKDRTGLLDIVVAYHIIPGEPGLLGGPTALGCLMRGHVVCPHTPIQPVAW